MGQNEMYVTFNIYVEFLYPRCLDYTRDKGLSTILPFNVIVYLSRSIYSTFFSSAVYEDQLLRVGIYA